MPSRPAPAIDSVAVIGAGAMGAEIAAAHLRREVPVTIFDADPAALDRGVQAAVEEAAFDERKAAVDPQIAARCRRLLRVGREDSQLAACRLILETVVENRDVKQRIFARIEPQLPAETILASNTSTLPIGDLAAALERPERFCGIHFCKPVKHRPLIEVVRGARTSDATIEAAEACARRIGKLPIVVNDGPGFLINRLLLPYMSESLHLLSDGAAIDQVEQAAEAFGMLLGPFAMYDMVGLDTALLAGRTLWEAFPERIEPSPILPALVKRGRLGRKRGAGFYLYRAGDGRREPDPELPKILDPYVRRRSNLTRDEITARLFLPMLLEATRAIQDRVVRHTRDIDLGVIHGLGFPPHRGGLLYWADSLGADRIIEMLKPLEALGPRAEPTPLLREAAESGRKLHTWGASSAKPGSLE